MNFQDKKGRVIKTGSRKPEALAAGESLWDKVINVAGDDVGFSIFMVGTAKGFHTGDLVLDNRDPNNPKITWLDQRRRTRKWPGREVDFTNKESLSPKVLPSGGYTDVETFLVRLRSKPRVKD